MVFEKVVRILAEEILLIFLQKGRNVYLTKDMQNTKYTFKKVRNLYIFNRMFHNSHFNMTSTVFPSTWQHGISGNKIKPIFPFSDLMRFSEIIYMLFTPSASGKTYFQK